MPILGGTTQHFRSYGKRKTNVTNKRAVLGGWETSPVKKDDSDSSDSSSSDEEVAPVVKKSLGQEKKVASMAKAVEIVVELPVKKKTVAAPPPPAATQKKRSTGPLDAEKENSRPAASKVAPSAATKGKGKAVNLPTAATVPSSPADAKPKPPKRAPLTSKLAPRAQAKVRDAPPKTKKATSRRPATPPPAVETEYETEEEEVEVAPPPPPRQKKASTVTGARRKAVVPSSDEEEVEAAEQEARFVPETQFKDVLPPPSSSPISWPLSSAPSRESTERLPQLSRRSSPARPTKSVTRPSSSSPSSLHLTPDRHRTSRYSRTSHSSFASRPSSSPLASPLPSPSFTASRPSPLPSPHPIPPSVLPLFPHLLSPQIFSFTSFLSLPPSPLAYFSSEAARAEWRKIGEASYSEVFETMGEDGGEVVLKIIPIVGEGGEGGEGEEMPYMSEADAVRREIEVSQLLGGGEAEDIGEGTGGFVRFKGAFLVQGAYPDALLASWDAYKAAQSPPCDDQIRPDVLPSTQLYALLLLSNAGSDLETYKLRNWTEAASVVGQVVETLTAAEEQCLFEHRDLHWGNILLSPTLPSSPHLPSLTPKLHKRFSSLSVSGGISSGGRYSLLPSSSSAVNSRLVAAGSKLDLTAEASGIRATLIDFTLSRLEKSAGTGDEQGGVLFDGFEDECVFEGEGDHQFDVYRSMRSLVELEGGGWEASHLRTNVLWLHYLILKLLKHKKLKPPPSLSSLSSSSSAVPSSPFRSSSRRSFAPSTSLTFPASPARRARTLPSSRSLSAAAPQLSPNELEREHAAYGLLVRAEEVLEGVIERWGLASGVEKKGRGRGKKVATAAAAKKGGRRKTVASEGEEEEGEKVEFGSAGKFGKWWDAAIEGA